MNLRVSRRDVRRLLQLIERSLRPRAGARLRARLNKDPELAQAHQQLLEAKHLLRDLRHTDVPELAYRQIEAQVRWRAGREDHSTRVRSERRPPRDHRARRPILALSAAALAGAIFGGTTYHLFRLIAQRDQLVDDVSMPTETMALPQPQELAALGTLAAGEVTVALATGDIVPLSLSRPVLVGERVITGANGLATLQWGQDSGIELAGRSEVEVRQLDTEGQVVTLWQGSMTAQVKPAASHRKLEVLVGPLRVQVTGTHFGVRLAADAAEVEVYRGTVRVRTKKQGAQLPADGVRLPAGRRLRVRLDGEGPAPGSEPLDSSEPHPQLHLQAWPSLHRVLASTGLMTIESRPPGATLRFDTVEIGRTDLRLRASAGRHLVELWHEGKPLRRQWVLFSPSGNDRLALDVRSGPRAKRAALPEGIYDTFRRRAQQIRSCYERQLKRNPTLSGKLVLRVRVDGKGRVDRASLDKDTLRDSVVGECAIAAVKRWRFPAQQPVEIVYPFTFQPAQ